MLSPWCIITASFLCIERVHHIVENIVIFLLMLWDYTFPFIFSIFFSSLVSLLPLLLLLALRNQYIHVEQIIENHSFVGPMFSSRRHCNALWCVVVAVPSVLFTNAWMSISDVRIFPTQLICTANSMRIIERMMERESARAKENRCESLNWRSYS